MQAEHPNKWIIEENDGMVLILVMLVLLAAIVIGIYTVFSSNTAIKIANNEAAYKKEFYRADGTTEYVIANLYTVLENLTTAGVPLAVNETRDISNDVMNIIEPSSVSYNPLSKPNTSVKITYEKRFEDPPGTWKRHYKIVSRSGNQRIEVGVETGDY